MEMVVSCCTFGCRNSFGEQQGVELYRFPVGTGGEEAEMGSWQQSERIGHLQSIRGFMETISFQLSVAINCFDSM